MLRIATPWTGVVRAACWPTPQTFWWSSWTRLPCSMFRSLTSIVVGTQEVTVGQVECFVDVIRSLLLVSVTKVLWCKAPTPKHPADKMTLASADVNGHIIIWNVKVISLAQTLFSAMSRPVGFLTRSLQTGEVKVTMQENSRAVQEMQWLDGRWDGSGHLLAALHPPFTFVLWDTSNGAQVRLQNSLAILMTRHSLMASH